VTSLPLFEIVLADHAVPLGEQPLTVGRASNNAVVLADETVSWHHAQIWIEGGVAWLRDLGSRNGTFLNDERVVGSTPMADGDVVRIGATATLTVRGAMASSPFRIRHVEDAATTIRYLVRSDRFLLGAAPGCDLRVEGWPARAATILLHDNGEIWVGTDDDEWQVEPGVEFEVRGRRLRVVEEAVPHAPTVEWGPKVYPYEVQAASDDDGPRAVLVDPTADRSTVLTGNRGVLLYLLARKLAKDRGAGASRGEEGWVSTDDAVTGVWGRGQKSANHLNVLVHRLRGQLAEEGFDPWFVEKRRGAIRLRVRDVTLR
jgi:hypothetical protein